MVRVGGAVVEVSYDTPELRSRLDIAFNAIHGMHQPSMNLKTYFVSKHSSKMNDNEMMKLKSTKFSSSLRVHSFLLFILMRASVVWEVFSPPLKLSPPPK
jgi:hypothetical protein